METTIEEKIKEELNHPTSASRKSLNLPLAKSGRSHSSQRLMERNLRILERKRQNKS